MFLSGFTFSRFGSIRVFVILNNFCVILHNSVIKSYAYGILKAACKSRIAVLLGKLPGEQTGLRKRNFECWGKNFSWIYENVGREVRL
jgi:hypothetical protein